MSFSRRPCETQRTKELRSAAHTGTSRTVDRDELVTEVVRVHLCCRGSISSYPGKEICHVERAAYTVLPFKTPARDSRLQLSTNAARAVRAAAVNSQQGLRR